MGTRERMIEAAERVMREKGLARATTKEIAREAGFSEGAIYKHFDSKEELFINVLTDRLPPFANVVRELPQRVGRDALEDVLEEVARSALAFYMESFPMSASIFSDPTLLVRHREEIRRKGAGPEKPNEALAAYLEAERSIGRVREDADPEASAAMLLGACFQRAFLENFSGGDGDPAGDEEFVRNVVRCSMRNLLGDT